MSSPSILVLDDDVAICRILRQMLSLEAYEVRITQSVAEALAAIKEKAFDACILDHRVRDGSGLDVAERLRAMGSGAPIILISGYDLSKVAPRLRHFGCLKSYKSRFLRTRFLARSGSPSSQHRLLISTRRTEQSRKMLSGSQQRSV